jgi:hypothetical protein
MAKTMKKLKKSDIPNFVEPVVDDISKLKAELIKLLKDF